MKMGYFFTLVGISVCSLLFGVIVLFLPNHFSFIEGGTVSQKEEVKDHFDFSFLSSHRPFPFPDLDKTILPLGINTRPDAPLHPDILLRVGSEEIIVPSNKTVYLSSQKGISLSQEPTSLSLKNTLTEDGLIQMEVAIRVLENEKKSVFRFEDFKRDVTITEAFPLKEGELLGPDCLFELYGGREYQEKKGKMRLKFHDGHLIFVGQGDFLTFNEGKWTHGKSRGAPLAEVISVSPIEAELKVWDQSGFKSELIKLNSGKSLTPLPQAATLFTKLRRKTATKVTSRVGQKTMILKKGDWLMRTKNGWRSIKTAKELSDCLNYKLQGELFICDGIEKNQFTGTLFNENRTVTQKIKLPFGEAKKK